MLALHQFQIAMETHIKIQYKNWFVSKRDERTLLNLYHQSISICTTLCCLLLYVHAFLCQYNFSSAFTPSHSYISILLHISFINISVCRFAVLFHAHVRACDNWKQNENFCVVHIELHHSSDWFLFASFSYAKKESFKCSLYKWMVAFCVVQLVLAAVDKPQSFLIILFVIDTCEYFYAIRIVSSTSIVVDFL